MKKHLLLALSICGFLTFAQNRPGANVPTTSNTVKSEVHQPPTKAVVYLQHNDMASDVQNLKPAALLYAQPTSASAPTGTITSQDFGAAYPTYANNAADDFTVPAGFNWAVSSVFVNGEVSTSTKPNTYNVTFYANSGSNLPGATIRTEQIILATASEDPTLLLATPLNLTPGTYWVSVQAVMDFDTSGQWFWNSYDDPTTLGAPIAWINPGGGFGTTCTGWNTASICIPTQTQKDLQFSLDGTATPVGGATICKTYVGRILSTDPTETTRLYRDGVPSICGTTKVYPAPAFSGNYHYKSYTIQNTLATTNCVTVNLTNPDPANPVHLVAYSGTFNPANIALNYMGDSGGSSVGGTQVTMSITMPANSTMVIVANESSENSTFSGDYTLDIFSADCGGILRTVENTKRAAVNVYPNPTTGVLFVNGMQPKQANVFDVSGKLIPTKVEGNTIDTQKLPKGNYILKMEDKEGNSSTTKFIKK